MQAINSANNSANNMRDYTDGSSGRAPGPDLKKDSIVEAERRGNLVIASLAFCVLGTVVALAVS